MKILSTHCALSLTVVLSTLTFSSNEGTPGSYAQVRVCFLGKRVLCCPWNLVSSLGSYRTLSCSIQN